MNDQDGNLWHFPLCFLQKVSGLWRPTFSHCHHLCFKNNQVNEPWPTLFFFSSAWQLYLQVPFQQVSGSRSCPRQRLTVCSCWWIRTMATNHKISALDLHLDFSLSSMIHQLDGSWKIDVGQRLCLSWNMVRVSGATTS